MSSRAFLIKSLASLLLAFVFSLAAWGQAVSPTAYKSQEVSETSGVPVLLMHLPDWEQHRSTAKFAVSSAEMKSAVGGERALLNIVDFPPGTEAATASYDTGKLLIIEYASPAVSAEMEQKIDSEIYSNGDGKTLHKRIGNYNVITFDAFDKVAATALMDQVKYEKNVQWLGRNPFEISRAERDFVVTTSDIFMSTLLVIVGGIVVAICGGLVVGFVFFAMRDRRRAVYTAHTDGGGMTRLNLDGFTSEIGPERLLGE